MGRIVSFARYGAALRAGLKSRAWWSVDECERTCVAMERDDLRGKTFIGRLNVEAFYSHMASHGSTSERGLCLEDKAIKAYSQKAMVMSVLTPRSEEHKRCCKLLCAVCEVLSWFHSKQNEEQRSVEVCSSWQVDIASGGYWSHVVDTVVNFKDVNTMTDAGFQLTMVESVFELADLAATLGVADLEH